MHWIKQLLSRRRVYSDLSQEIREHLAEKIDELVASGMSREDATRAARREFGNATLIEERGREVWQWPSTESLIADIRYALRMLRKNPAFTAVAVVTLALGIGANTAIFNLIDAVMLRTLPVSRPEELIQVRIYDPRKGGEADPTFTNPIWEQLRDRQDVFSDVFAWGHEQFDLAQGGAVHYAKGMWVSGGFYNALGLRPTAGRLIAPSDDRRGCPAVAVLSYGFWQDHYGGASSAIGSTLSLNDRPFEVIGVAPSGFWGMEVGERFDVAAPICAAAQFNAKGWGSRLDDRSYWWLRVVGRVKPGIARARLSARLSGFSPGVFVASLPQDWSSDMQQEFLKQVLTAVPAATGTSLLRQQFQQPLRIVMAVVGLVLLIACANIASLMLARAAARHKEIAVRQALGASRGRLVRQLLTESLMLAVAGALLGVLFARWGAAVLVRYLSTAHSTVFLDLSFDGRVLGFTAAIAALTAILFGLLPALRSTRVSLASAMKGSPALELDRPARFRARKSIVALQVALSLVLLVAAGLLLRSFVKLATLDLGFDRNGVLLVSTNLGAAKVAPDSQPGAYDAIQNRLRALPGVISVSRSHATPISGDSWNQSIRTEWSKGLTGHNALVWLNSVSPGFFQTLRMEVLAGLDFNQNDTKTAPAVAIINETLARRFFPSMNPIGKTFRIDDISGQPGPPVEVIAMVRDAKYESVREDTPPTAFFPVAQAPAFAEAGNFELRTAVPPYALVSQVETAIAGVNKRISLEFDTLAEQVNDSMAPERLLALLSGFFGVLALLLAMIGLYGTLSYLVTQRRTEFGVRMALGAGAGSILSLVMRDLIVVLAAGLAGGVLVSLAATRVLRQMLFGLGPRDAVTMVAAAGAVLLAVAAAACYVPARRATRVDPMVALRYE
jgi:putative ABC transport system permease protein